MSLLVVLVYAFVILLTGWLVARRITVERKRKVVEYGTLTMALIASVVTPLLYCIIELVVEVMVGLFK